MSMCPVTIVLKVLKGNHVVRQSLLCSQHSGPFPEISNGFVLLRGREEVNGSESTPVEMESTMDPQKPQPGPVVSTSWAWKENINVKDTECSGMKPNWIQSDLIRK